MKVCTFYYCALFGIFTIIGRPMPCVPAVFFSRLELFASHQSEYWTRVSHKLVGNWNRCPCSDAMTPEKKFCRFLQPMTGQCVH